MMQHPFRFNTAILRFTILSTLLFIITNTFSQTIHWGVEKKISDSYKPNVIIGEDGERFYVRALHGGKRYYIEAYDLRGEMNKIYNVRLERYESSAYDFESTSLLNDRIVIFVSYYDKKVKETSLYCTAIDTKTGKVVVDHKELIKQKVKNKNRSGTYYIDFSPNNKNIIVNHYGYNPILHRYADNYKLLNENFEVILKLDASRIKEEINVSTSTNNYNLDDDGNLYYLEKEKKSKKHSIVSRDVETEYEKWREKVPFTTSMINRGPDSFDHKVLHFTSENKLIFLSTFKNSIGTTLEGYYFAKLDMETKEIEMEKLSLFDSVAWKSINKNDWLKTSLGVVETGWINDSLSVMEKNARLNAFAPTLKRVELFNYKNGEVVVISELYEKTTSGAEIFRSYGDMIVSKLDTEGRIIWTTLIPKRQLYKTSGLTVSSYHKFKHRAGIFENNFNVVYFDHEDNSFGQPSTELKTMRDNSKVKAVIRTINLDTGELTGKDISDPAIPKEGDCLNLSIANKTESLNNLILFYINSNFYKYGIISNN